MFGQQGGAMMLVILVHCALSSMANFKSESNCLHNLWVVLLHT